MEFQELYKKFDDPFVDRYVEFFYETQFYSYSFNVFDDISPKERKVPRAKVTFVHFIHIKNPVYGFAGTKISGKPVQKKMNYEIPFCFILPIDQPQDNEFDFSIKEYMYNNDLYDYCSRIKTLDFDIVLPKLFIKILKDKFSYDELLYSNVLHKYYTKKLDEL